MAPPKTRTWLWIPLALVALPVAIGILLISTTQELHPDPQAIPEIADAAPLPGWSAAVERGRALVLTRLREQNLPGVSVAVGVGGEIVWAEGFGYADLSTGQPVTPRHQFRLGTASIALTSAAVGLLAEEGQLNLDDPIQDYIAGYPAKPWPVTLRHLMGHTAGIRSDGGDEGPLFAKHCESPVEALPAFSEAGLLFEPGTDVRPSSFGWILVSAAIESASGQPFLEFMRDRIFAPIGMLETEHDRTTAEGDAEDFPLVNLTREVVIDPGARLDRGEKGTATPATPHRVTPYFPRFAADPSYGLHLMRPLDLSCYAGASVFVSTASDLARFGMAIRNGELLRASTVDMLQAHQLLTSGKETGYGLGWELKTATLAGQPVRMAGYTGEVLGGPSVSLLTFPERQMTVAVMSNISYSDPYSLGVQIAQAFAEPSPQ